MCKWKEKSERRLVVCGLDRPAHSGVNAVQIKENKTKQKVSGVVNVRKIFTESLEMTLRSECSRKIQQQKENRITAHNGNKRLASFSTYRPLTP